MIARLLSAGAIQKDNAQITSRKRGLLFGGAYSAKHFSPLSTSVVYLVLFLQIVHFLSLAKRLLTKANA